MTMKNKQRIIKSQLIYRQKRQKIFKQINQSQGYKTIFAISMIVPRKTINKLGQQHLLGKISSQINSKRNNV